jgi:hypothetical protein
MSFLKNILGAFVEFKEETKENEVIQGAQDKGPEIPVGSQKVNAQDVSGQQVQQPGVDAGSSIAPTNVPSQYQKHFEDLIDEANHKNPLFQGTDFKEFIESKGDVEGIADEATRYRTAFNVLKRTGLTKEKLVTTGREYVNIIDRDVKAFEAVFLDQYKTQVELKERQLQQKAQELQTLTLKIEALNKEMKQIGQEVLSGKDRLNSNKNSFIAAADNKKKEIETELKKIDQYFS